MKAARLRLFIFLSAISFLYLIPPPILQAQDSVVENPVPSDTEIIPPVDIAEETDALDVLMVSTSSSTNATPQSKDFVAFSEEEASQYTLGKSDIIEISVQRHPEVSGQYPINNEGKIQYDFVGDVYVEGLLKDEIKAKLTELLSSYIVSPEVTVKIIGYNSKVVYVYGEVGAPGKIFMRGDTITIREALIQAGLPLLSASLRKGQLITPANDGKAKNVKVDVHKLLYEGDLRQNLVMKPGDTLYVPATVLTKVMRALQPVAAPIGTAAGTGRTVTTGF